MKDFNNYVLVLPSWYPSRVHSFNGDFNQRFVKAVSRYQKQIVLYVIQDENLRKVDIEIIDEPNIITYIAYYPKSKFPGYNKYRFFGTYLNVLKSIFKKYGSPKLIHTYVFYPAGIISLYLKYRYGLKSLLTENWTTFYKERENYINNSSFFRKLVYKKIIKSFDVVISVANRLQKEIQKWNNKSENYIIPNVVETYNFNFNNVVEKNNSSFTFLHASTMGYQKNINGLLDVFERVFLKTESNIRLILAGSPDKEIIERINKSETLLKNVSYVGEIQYQQVANEMKSADAFILFSRYENMPCVLLESLCSGLPVISTNVGGIAEIIDNENGLLVENENEEQLEEAILYMVNNYSMYNRESISRRAIEKYNYDKIGEEIFVIYKSLDII